MMQWGTFQIAHGDVHQLGDRLMAFRETYRRLAAHRSEVLEAAVYVESRLEFLLCRLFIGVNETREALFRSFVLDPDTGSFHAKWRMLRGALEVVGLPPGSITEAERHEMSAGIRDVISTRNMFAHGDIFVDARDGRAFIQYYEGKRREEYVDDAFLRAYMGLAEMVAERMDQITSALTPHQA